MLIGLIFGGQGQEELDNMRSLKGIEGVLKLFGLESRRLYLNSPEFSIDQLKGVDIFLIIDSNCQQPLIREAIFTYFRRRNAQVIGQNEAAFHLARNKFQSSLIFNQAGILTPKSFLLEKGKSINLEKIWSLNHYPVIVKDNFGSSSENLQICFDQGQLIKAIKWLFKKCGAVLIEEYISGIELTIPFVKLFGREVVLEPVEVAYQGYVYDQKMKKNNERVRYFAPARILPDLSRAVKRLTARANHLIGCKNYSRLDVKIYKDKIYVLEINSEPVLAENDFLAVACRAAEINYTALVLGLLGNSSLFLNFAARKNFALHQFIKTSLAKLENLKFVSEQSGFSILKEQPASLVNLAG